MKGRTALLLLLLVSLYSCGGAQKELRKTVPPPPAQEEKTDVTKQVKEIPSDEELFSLGLSYLASPGVNPDYGNAYLAFKRLTENYPESRWRDMAQHFAALLDRYLKATADNSKLQMENQEIMRQRRLLAEEKSTWEEEKDQLLKEIAGLKSDLECLKKIEIESENREKNVR